jgi:hypothetical protein
MNEQIGVTYFPVLGGAGYHMAVFYTNRAGETSVIEVEPLDHSLGPVDQAKAFIQERFFSNSNTDSPWGQIVGGERQWKAIDMERPLELLKEDDDLSNEWNSIRSTLKDVMTRGYEYQGPFDQNSNTFVSDALRNARLPQPTGNVTDPYGNTTPYWAPGADRLTNPINQAFDDRFGKWGSAPSGVSPMAAPDLPGSFNNRFGSFSSVPVGGFGDTGFQPVPQNYSKTAAPSGAPSFSQLMSTGPFARNSPFLPAAGVPRSGPPPWLTLSGNPTQAAPPLQPDATPDTVDETPVRGLGRSTYSLSQGSAFDNTATRSPAAPSAPQGPLTLNEAYLEYRRRLGADQSPSSAFDSSAPAVPRNPSSIAPAPDDGGPLSLMEAHQQYRRRLDASQPQTSAVAADAGDSNFSGGLVGRLTALMRQYPDIYGPPPPQDDELPSYYRWMGNL